MQPHRPAHRRPSAQQFRVRRAIAATAVILVVVAGLDAAGVIGGTSAEDDAPAASAEETTTTTTIPAPPACAEGDAVVANDPSVDWATVLVDTARSLPPDFGPNDLHNIADAGFPLTDGLAVRSVVLTDLDALRQAAVANGTPLSILAGYRSFTQQAELFDRRVDELGGTAAGSRVARPGHSEHQLGTTIDVTTEGQVDVDQAWGATPQGQWVATNAHKYGFLLSYPSDASDRTCYDYEPWHLRYVGRELAADVIESGLTLREYLWRLDPVDITTTTTATTPPPP